MKKIITILLLTLITLYTQGQSVYDILLKSKSLFERGNSEQSISLLSDALVRSPDWRLYLLRASAYISMTKYDSAISDLESANRLKAGSGSYELARVFALKGDISASLKNLEINLASDSKMAEKTILLDPAFKRIENSQEWKLFWRTERYSHFETGLSELEYDASTGNQEEAENTLNSLLSDNLPEPGMIYAKALASFSGKKYQESVNILSGVSVSKMDERSLRLLAKAQTLAGNNSGATAAFTELISRETPDAKLYYLRADAYRKSGEREKALSDLQKYIELYPEDESALSLAGKTESETGDNIKALEYFSKNIELHPDVASNYIDRANAYFTSSSWKYAINDYSMALDLQPENSDTYLNKGISLINIGKSEDGCHDFRQALKLGNKKASALISKYCIE